MATMDIIKLKGGDPANFLDVGGGASEAQVQKAFEILNADPKVKTILVNIFGGIMRCDVIAAGILSAAKTIGMKKPIVIRLQGTNVGEAQKLIQASGFRMIVEDELENAATKAVAIAKYVQGGSVCVLCVTVWQGESVVVLFGRGRRACLCVWRVF
jgi:succinyl-CoA synthetase beta subunit